MTNVDRRIVEANMRLRDAILNDPVLAYLRKVEIERLGFVVRPMRAHPGGSLEFIESDTDRAAREEFERLSRKRIDTIKAEHGDYP